MFCLGLLMIHAGHYTNQLLLKHDIPQGYETRVDSNVTPLHKSQDLDAPALLSRPIERREGCLDRRQGSATLVKKNKNHNLNCRSLRFSRDKQSCRTELSPDSLCPHAKPVPPLPPVPPVPPVPHVSPVPLIRLSCRLGNRCLF